MPLAASDAPAGLDEVQKSEAEENEHRDGLDDARLGDLERIHRTGKSEHEEDVCDVAAHHVADNHVAVAASRSGDGNDELGLRRTEGDEREADDVLGKTEL